MCLALSIYKIARINNKTNWAFNEWNDVIEISFNQKKIQFRSIYAHTRNNNRFRLLQHFLTRSA